MVLLIDNYDSFTYNLYDYIAQLGKDCKVVRNDETNWATISKLDIESIVISPGPCTPAEAGISNKVIETYSKQKPILGICLGHQALGLHFGARLVKAPIPMHGKTSKITTQPHPLFHGMPASFEVMRYHSLAIQNIVPPMQSIATTEDGVNMVMVHESLPLVGVQFHPESILTKHGIRLLENWFRWSSKL